MEITNQLIIRREFLLEEARQIETLIKSAPPGTLSCYRNGERFKWYWKRPSQDGKGGKRIYLPVSQRDLAAQLAEKTKNVRRLRDIRKELAAINSYLTKIGGNRDSVAELLKKSPGFRELLLPAETQDEYIKKWLSEEYVRNPSYPEALKYKTITGDYVRSKSEALIYGMLTMLHIPFKYEAPLQLGKEVFYPDFTVLHPFERQVLRWEHFGDMSNERYQRRTRYKLRVYAEHGYYPGYNLIVTYESDNHPFDLEEIGKVIDLFFGIKRDTLRRGWES